MIYLAFLHGHAALLTAATILVQAACGPTAEVRGHLATRYGEVPVGAGLSQTGTIIEVWANARTGTWTLLETLPDGASCARSAGDRWQTPRAGES